MKPRKILFVCKYNAFRSRVAEEYFNKINKNKNLKATSRGFIMGGASDINQRIVAKRLLDIDIAKRMPLPVTIDDMKESDLIVVVADDIPKIMFNYGLSPIIKKVTIWKVKDEEKMVEKNIRARILLIKKKVNGLVGKLRNGN